MQQHAATFFAQAEAGVGPPRFVKDELDACLCADIDGFSLRAAVRCGADDRQVLEQLCRYVTAKRWPMNGR